MSEPRLKSVLAMLVVGMLVVACKPGTPPVPQSAAEEVPAVTELQITDVVMGAGEAVQAGQTAVVHYTGWLYDPVAADQRGRQFDSSRTKGASFSFPVGGGRVIAGWDQGVAGMKVGGQRRLVIPADLGYGSAGAGGVIPPNATLLFEVELLGIE